jgi:hypothetical protein
MFVRICPYLPFSARICLNQHHWLANRMREKGFFAHSQRSNGDRHMYAARTRFIPAEIVKFFEGCAWPMASAAGTAQMSACAPVDISARLRRMWNG